MADFSGVVTGPALDQILRDLTRAVDVLNAFFRGDRDLRASQAANEPLADGFQQGSNVNGTDTMTSPSGSIQQQVPFTTFIDGQEATAKKYSYLVVIIASTSGSGRYSLQKGLFPTQAGVGHEIPSGGTTITIPGTINLANFKMCPDAGATLNYTMQGFA